MTAALVMGLYVVFPIMMLARYMLWALGEMLRR